MSVFCVRNSGVRAVVESVGDHACEYMTGGVVVVLGETGRNFAAGMSGGIAFVYDEAGDFSTRFNPGLADLEAVADLQDISTLKDMIQEHLTHTGSRSAELILARWDESLHRFKKVMPRDYRPGYGREQAKGRAEGGSRAGSPSPWVNPPDSWTLGANRPNAARCSREKRTTGSFTSLGRRIRPKSRDPGAWIAPCLSATWAAPWET